MQVPKSESQKALDGNLQEQIYQKTDKRTAMDRQGQEDTLPEGGWEDVENMDNLFSAFSDTTDSSSEDDDVNSESRNYEGDGENCAEAHVKSPYPDPSFTEIAELMKKLKLNERLRGTAAVLRPEIPLPAGGILLQRQEERNMTIWERRRMRRRGEDIKRAKSPLNPAASAEPSSVEKIVDEADSGTVVLGNFPSERISDGDNSYDISADSGQVVTTVPKPAEVSPVTVSSSIPTIKVHVSSLVDFLRDAHTEMLSPRSPSQAERGRAKRILAQKRAEIIDQLPIQEFGDKTLLTIENTVELRDQLQQCRRDNKQLREEVERLCDEQDRSNIRAEARDQALCNADRTQADLRRKLRDREDYVKRCKKQAAIELQVFKAEHMVEIGQLETRIQQCEDEWRRQMEAKDGEIKKLKAELEENEKIKETYDGLEAESSEREAQIEQLYREIRGLHWLLESKGMEINQLEESNKDLKERLEDSELRSRSSSKSKRSTHSRRSEKGDSEDAQAEGAQANLLLELLRRDVECWKAEATRLQNFAKHLQAQSCLNWEERMEKGYFLTPAERFSKGYYRTKRTEQQLQKYMKMENELKEERERDAKREKELMDEYFKKITKRLRLMHTVEERRRAEHGRRAKQRFLGKDESAQS